MHIMSFFCTAGRGTEIFVEKEIRQKLNLAGHRDSQICPQAQPQVKVIDGKVFFHCEVEVDKLLSLKTVERLFVSIHHDASFKCYRKSGLSHLRNTVQTVPGWREALTTWQQLQKQPHCKKSQDLTEPDVNGLKVKKSKLDDSDIVTSDQVDGKSHPVTFRVSCKCSGFPAKNFSHQEFSKVIARTLSQKLDWKVDLRSPHLEVYVQINNEGLTIGLPVTKIPLSRRDFIKKIGLRSTVSWIMADLAEIKPNEVVLDPMCGAATVLIESATSKMGCWYIGCDNSRQQLEKAVMNVQGCEQLSSVSLIHADARALPFADGSIDVVTSDLPFGINHSSIEEVKAMYPRILSQINRVVKPGGRIVLLTSDTLKEYLLKTVQDMRQVASEPCLLKVAPQTNGSEHKCHSVISVSARNDNSRSEEEDNSTHCLKNMTDSKLSLIHNPISSEEKDLPTLINMSSALGETSEAELKQNFNEESGMLNVYQTAWRIKATYSVKLGETLACICVFCKIKDI